MQKLRSLHSQLRSDLKKAKATLGLITSMPGFLRDRVTVEEAEREIQSGLATREKRFLELINTGVYKCHRSPYQKLLRFAGCTYSDLQIHVRRYGIEKTLEQLANEGVYLTPGEFKGKKTVIRGQLSFRVSPEDFEQAKSSPGFLVQSSGSSNRPMRSFTSLERVLQQAYVMALCFSAHDLFSCLHAVYDAILPGSSGVNQLIYRAKMGIRTDRWFARRIPANSWLENQYFYLTTYLIVGMGKLFGPGFPRPEFLDVQDFQHIVRWIEENRRQGKVCAIRTAASNATRIAQTAWKMGVSLEGSKCLVGGEPYTEAKAKTLERVGLSCIPRYSFNGGGNVGNGCANSVYRDEVHLNGHMMAVIRHTMSLNKDAPAIYPLLFTALQPFGHLLLLNVANGDYATLETRDCGCALQRIGLTTHLHHIRSYEKFASEGMNYFYGDLSEFIETTLPSEFGGGPGDYQLVEEEDDNAQTRLSLVVHPQIGDLDEEKVLALLRVALSNGSRNSRFMTEVWENAGNLQGQAGSPACQSAEERFCLCIFLELTDPRPRANRKFHKLLVFRICKVN